MIKFLKVPAPLINIIPPVPLMAYSIIADACHLKAGCCFISQKNIAARCHTSERTIRKMLKTLEYLGLIKYHGYNSAGTVQYIAPELSDDLLKAVQWKLAGGRWEIISDVANTEIRGHKVAT